MREVDNRVFIAVERGDAKAALAALEQGGDPSVFNHEGCTALMAAAFKGCVPCVQALAYASDANAQCGADHAFSMTALMLAAGEGHVECVELLLPLSDPALRDKMGQTALHLAAYGGSRRCVELLAKNCDPHALDSQGKSALAQAVDSRQVECARVLVDLSDADHPDNSGFSPLSAAVLNQDAACVQLLLPYSSPANRSKAFASAKRRGDEHIAALIWAYQNALAEEKILKEWLTAPIQAPLLGENGNGVSEEDQAKDGSGKGRRL
jgi:ankyrin repeat protein